MWPSTWSFSLPSWAVSNSLQKRLVKFLLRRTVGQFLKTELDDENLDVQLSGGQLRLKNVQLSEEALNDAIVGLPVIVCSGAIGSISVSVPWTQLWTAHCEVQIDNLVIKAQLADDELPLDKDGSEAEEHWMGGRSHMAESVAMTEGGASILASSVFIADDFLRAETLGYGSKDEMFINKDVERLVANAHEERAQYYRASLGSGEARQQGRRSFAVDADDEDVFEDCADNLPLPPGSPGGSVRGLQVVSEMVDRIISAVNIRVHNITVECLVGTRDENTGETANATLKLSVANIDFVDDRSNTERKSGVAMESGGKRNISGDGSGSDRDHPVGIEYKVIEYRTLFKLLEIKGLRMSLLSDTAAEVPVISLLGTPISAHLRIHRRMPFSELAPVRPSDSGSSGSGGRPKSANGSESLYMGPMPGEFREAKAASPHISPTSATYAQGSSGTRARNAIGEEATTSGWDVSVEIGDVVCILTKDQLQSILAIARTAAPLLKLASERQDVKHRYQAKFGDKVPEPAADALPQLARWISVKCRHLYVAVVPHAPIEALQNWQDCTSLAVLRLNLEASKHLGLYVKGVGAKWECIPASGTRSESSASTEHVGTEFWAAATRQITSGGAFQTATITAYMQSVSVYDSDPESHPVFQPLVIIDRSLAAPECQRHEKRAFAEHARRNSDKYDVWMCTSESDPVLTINVGPIIVVLDKELADRLAIYQELIVGMLSAEPTAEHIHNRGSRAFAKDAYGGSDVAGSIEDLMNNLRIQAKHKMPLSIAVCSPLIRTWIRLPGTTANSGKKDGTRTSQTGSRASKHDIPAPGHFCIDAVDAVITNVVNGTAASTQSQNDVPEGHLRHPHIQELLESRKSVAGSGIRVECEALDISVQSIEGSSTIDHIASVRGPSSAAESFHEAVSIPRPHIEITTVANSGRQTPDRDSAEQFGRRPPAFDAFSVVDDNIRVRMAPESELTTSLKFERLAVALSRLVVSCHLPETEISLGRATYQRLNAVINDFMLWQSIQEEVRAIAAAAVQHTYDTPAYATSTTDDRAELGVSVLVDMPQMVARINTTDTYSADIPGAASESQRVRLSNTQAFISNAIIERGRMYVSFESNQVRLSSFVNESEVGAVLSHSFATPESPIFTPQLSLYMLTSPKITEESEVVLKTSWTTVDYQNDSTCLRNLEAFFSSPGTSGLVQPPPKPMRLSLNVQNSSLMWTPAGDPSICSAALSLDSLAVIVGINSPAPARDREELHYYIEGLSIFAKSTDSLANAAVDVSSDAWVSTGRFWKDHGYAVLVHMDMVDVASRSKEGEDGPLIDLKLYSEALVLDACADSVSSLPLLIQGLIADLTGSAGRQASETKRSNKTRVFSPQMLGKSSDDIFGDVDNDTFAMAPLPPTASKVAYAGRQHSHRSSHLSGDHRNSFTDDFENGRDDISALAMEEYFAPHVPPDEVEEYEVVGGGRVLSPASTMQPMYSRRSSQHQQPTLPSRRSSNVSATARQPLDIRRDSKGKSASKTLAGSTGSASVGVAGGRSRSYSFGDDDDEDFDLQDYVNMDSDSDMLSEEEEAEYRSEFAASAKSQPFQLQSRFSGQQVNAGGSVLLEPERPSPALRSPKSKSLAGGFLPSARIIDDVPAIHGSISGSGRGESVKVTALPEEEDISELGDKDKGDVLAGDGTSLLDGSVFELIEDYFKAPAPGDTESDDDGSGLAADGNNHIICLTVDVARVEVNLYSGQDWYVSAEQPVRSSSVVPGYMASYMDDYNDSVSVAMGGYSESLNGRVSASMPESRGPLDYRSSPLASPRSPRKQGRQPGRPARRSAKPKIELRATHVHAEYKQFSEDSATAYDLGLNVGMLEILDQLESSEWSKFLTRRRDAKTGLPSTLHSLATTRNRDLLTKGTSDSDRVTSSYMRRQRSSRWPDSNSGPMICIRVESVRPYATLVTEELRVDVEISPLRCYIHQDALDFLITFFETSERHSAILANIKRAQEQAMNPEAAPSQRGGAAGAHRAGIFEKRRASSVNHPYFQIVRIAPINVIFDYKPRRLRTVSGSGGSSSAAASGVQSGAAAAGGISSSPSAAVTGASPKAGTSLSSSRKPVELLNFFPLEDAEMTLNTVKVRGVAGVSKLIRELGSSWLPHLTQTQIPGVVSGMTPLRSLVNIGSGMADLVILPLEQYRKDGRLVQGIKRGAKSFARTTAMEAIQLGAKVAINAQTLLEQAGDILNVDVASGESSNPNSHDGRLDGALSPHGADQQPHIVVDLADWPDYMSADGHGSLAGTEHSASVAGGSGGRRISFNKSKYARQPENLSEGMRQAYMSLRSNVGDAVQTILAIPVVVQENEADGYVDDSGVPGRSPVHGSVRAVVRAVPVAVLKPMIGATEAVSKTLLGLRNTMEPARRGQLEDKYKSRSLNAKKSYPS